VAYWHYDVSVVRNRTFGRALSGRLGGSPGCYSARSRQLGTVVSSPASLFHASQAGIVAVWDRMQELLDRR
jgi:hypothetical protein